MKDQQRLAFVDASFSHGQRNRGVESSFDDLIKHRKPHKDQNGCGKVSFYKKSGALNRDPHKITKELLKRAQKAALSTDRQVYIGGDHSISIATVRAQLAKHPDLGVIWLDAHADINTQETSPTGNIHGMVVSDLMQLSPQSYLGVAERGHPLSTKKIVYIGLRSIDPGEQRYLDLMGIKYFTTDQVFSLGMDVVAERAIKYLDDQMKCPIHLSFDLDVVDPEIAPSTGVPVSHGLIPEQVYQLTEKLNKTGRCVSMDLVEFDPAIGSTQAVEQSRKICLETLDRFIGKPLSTAQKSSQEVPHWNQEQDRGQLLEF